jgi:hypothetical protein
MNTLSGLLRLSPGEVATLCRLGVLLILAEGSLRIWSLRTILHALDKRSMRARAASSVAPASGALVHFARLVELADRHGLCRPSCLRRALVVTWVLSGRGIAAILKIGVTKDQQDLSAHAWVEVARPRPMCLLAEPDFVDLLPPAGSPERA